jgi:hypothetical protein
MKRMSLPPVRTVARSGSEIKRARPSRPRVGAASPDLADVSGVCVKNDGEFFCAVLGDGSLWCWPQEPLDPDSGVADDVPRRDDVVPGASDLAMGRMHSCAVMLDRTVACWGNNDVGQLGDGTLEASESAVNVVGVSSANGVAVGAWHSCAWLEDGDAWCRGSNEHGQLGTGTTRSERRPDRVIGLGAVVQMTAAQFHRCARCRDGRVSRRGDNAFRAPRARYERWISRVSGNSDPPI